MTDHDLVNLISRLARYSGEDETTGLRNLRQFLQDTERELARSRRTGEGLRVLVVEPEEETSLTGTVQDVQECLRDEDLLARIGSRCLGLLVADGPGFPSAEDLTARLDLMKKIAIGECKVAPDCCETTPARELLHRAFEALALAKADGGGRHVAGERDFGVVH